MKHKDSQINDFYQSGLYQEKNPTLHEEDSPWKSTLILPLIEKVIAERPRKKNLTLLDVGGGAGLILSSLTRSIAEKLGITVKKIALDLSPGMLEVQRKNNPDMVQCLHQDIKKTSLADRSVDITLMIDVIEHIPNPEKAIREISRISEYCIFKVPLEDNFNFNLINIFDGGALRKILEEDFGHINNFDKQSITALIETSGMEIIMFRYSGVFRYLLSSEHYRNKTGGWENFTNYVGALLHPLSPKLAAFLLPDYAIILARSLGYPTRPDNTKNSREKTPEQKDQPQT